ncbi:hypothetical protein D3C87_1647280 [compost metagenome]
MNFQHGAGGGDAPHRVQEVHGGVDLAVTVHGVLLQPLQGCFGVVGRQAGQATQANNVDGGGIRLGIALQPDQRQGIGGVPFQRAGQGVGQLARLFFRPHQKPHQQSQNATQHAVEGAQRGQHGFVDVGLLDVADQHELRGQEKGEQRVMDGAGGEGAQGDGQHRQGHGQRRAQQ